MLFLHKILLLSFLLSSTISLAQWPKEYLVVKEKLEKHLSNSTLEKDLDSIHNRIPPSDTSEIAYLLLKGIYWTETNDLKKAASYFHKSYNLSERLENYFFMAGTLHNQATLVKRQSNYAAAIQYLSRAQKVLPLVPIPSCSLEAVILNDLGVVYKRLGQYDKAIYYFQQCLHQKEHCPALPSTSYWITQNNLAGSYLAVEAYDAADSIYQVVYQLKKKNLGESHPSTLIALHNRAVLLKKQQRLEEAKSILLQVLQLKEKTYPSVTYANTLYSLADVYLELKAYDSVRISLDKLIPLRTRLLGKEHPQTLQAITLEAEYFTRLQQWDQALDLFKQIWQVKWKEIHYYYDYLSEEEKLDYIKKHLGFWKSYSETVWLYHYQTKDTSQLNPVMTQWLQHRYHIKELALRQELNQAYLTADCPKMEELIDSLHYYRNQYAQQVLQDNHYSDYWSDQIHRIETTLDNSCGTPSPKKEYHTAITPTQLSSNEIYIEIIREVHAYNQRYVALIQHKKSAAPVWLYLGEIPVMEGKAYSYYSNKIKFTGSDTKSYATYWAKLDEYIQKTGARKVYFVRDGIYHFISIPGLLQSKKVNYTVEVWSDVTVADKPLQSPLKEHSLNIFYAPQFCNGDTCVFPPLDGTEQEGKQIAELFRQHQWTVTCYTDTLAGEVQLKEQTPPTILHIATHGYYQPISEERFSYVEAMVSSGLIGTEVRNQEMNGEDGFCTAYELSNLDWSNTQLVVLSACQSGMGQVSELEGVYGLVRAIRQSGAAYSLVSLWKVDDVITAEWMSTFYQNVLNSFSYETAYKNTLEQIRQKHPEPKYWAGFVLSRN